MWIDVFFRFELLLVFYVLYKWISHFLTGRSQLERILIKARQKEYSPDTLMLLGTSIVVMEVS